MIDFEIKPVNTFALVHQYKHTSRSTIKINNYLFKTISTIDSRGPSSITWPPSTIDARRERSSGANWSSTASPHSYITRQTFETYLEQPSRAPTACTIILWCHVNRFTTARGFRHVFRHFPLPLYEKGTSLSKSDDKGFGLTLKAKKEGDIKKYMLHNVNISVHRSHETATHQSGHWHKEGRRTKNSLYGTRTPWPSHAATTDRSRDDAARFRMSLHISRLPKTPQLVMQDLDSPCSPCTRRMDPANGCTVNAQLSAKVCF